MQHVMVKSFPHLNLNYRTHQLLVTLADIYSSPLMQSTQLETATLSQTEAANSREKGERETGNETKADRQDDTKRDDYKNGK